MSAVDVQGELTIYTVAEQMPVWMQALAAEGGLTLKLGGVSEIDTAGLQLLILARREALRQGKQVVFDAPSQAVQDVLALANIDTHFHEQLFGLAEQAEASQP